MNYFSDKNHDLCCSNCFHYHNYKVEVLHCRQVIGNDVIIMYDIIKFHIEIIYWMI